MMLHHPCPLSTTVPVRVCACVVYVCVYTQASMCSIGGRVETDVCLRGGAFDSHVSPGFELRVYTLSQQRLRERGRQVCVCRVHIGRRGRQESLQVCVCPVHIGCCWRLPTMRQLRAKSRGLVKVFDQQSRQYIYIIYTHTHIIYI
jgi:hypothetical protein